MVDVMATMIDGIAILVNGKCYCHCDRWNSHIGWNVLIMADVVACVADGMATGSIVLFYFILHIKLNLK